MTVAWPFRTPLMEIGVTVATCGLCACQVNGPTDELISMPPLSATAWKLRLLAMVVEVVAAVKQPPGPVGGVPATGGMELTVI